MMNSAIPDASWTLPEAVAFYARLDMPVFPLGRGTKLAMEGSRSFHDATTDFGQIQAWWTKCPEANIGMPTGPPSRLWVLDSDPSKLKQPSGEETLRQLFGDDAERLVATPLRSVTPSGGIHYFYRWNEESIRCRAGDIGPGLDTRGAGGYVVLPPSTIKQRNGDQARGTYRWQVSTWPEAGAVPAAPRELCYLATFSTRERVEIDRDPELREQLIANPIEARQLYKASCAVQHRSAITDDSRAKDNAYLATAIRREVDAVATAPVGRQEFTLNASALRLGSLLARIGAHDQFDAVVDRLVKAGLQMKNDPRRRPWTEHEIRARVVRAMSDGMRSPRRPGAKKPDADRGGRNV